MKTFTETLKNLPAPLKENGLRLALFICIVDVIILALANPISTRWVDFQVYWDAGLNALEHTTVYDTTVYMQYRYSPFIALLFGWILAPLGFEWASWIFQKVSLFGWIWLFLVWIRDSISHSAEHSPGHSHSLATRPASWKAFVAPLFLTFLFFGSALRLDLQFGQVNSFTFILLYLGMRWSEAEDTSTSRRNWMKLTQAALVLALAIQMKLFCLIALFPLVVKWRIRTGLLTLFFLGLTVYGGTAAYHGSAFAKEELSRWFLLLNESTPDLMLGYTNVNILGVFGRWFGLSIAKALWGIALVLYVALCWRCRKQDFISTFALGSAAIYFLHPLTWTYWVLFLVPGFLLALQSVLRGGRNMSHRWHWLLLPAAVTFNMQHSHFVKEWPLLVASVLATVWALRILRVEPDSAARPERPRPGPNALGPDS